jgi:hypothetical protein
MRYFAVLLAFLVAGCATTGEDRSARIEQRYGPTCAGLGYEKGSKEYRDCLTRLYAAWLSRD